MSVTGDFNDWDPEKNRLDARQDGSGIWEGRVTGDLSGQLYKYRIKSKYNGYTVDKGDPYAYFWEMSPRTASIVWKLDHEWGDAEWMKNRRQKNAPRRAHVGI